MNVYDFDKTIYSDDSTVDFFKYCLKQKPSLALRYGFGQLFAGLKFGLGIMKKTAFKERFYRFFKGIEDIDAMVASFWKAHAHKIQPWYLSRQDVDDVVISASPTFLLAPICAELGIKQLIASLVDKKTGAYTGLNCHGEEKVKRFYAVFPNGKVDAFYSDSFSDTPMAKLASKAYLIKKGQVFPWPSSKL